MLEDIISGAGELREAGAKVGGLCYRFKEIADRILCVDGTEISVQASSFHYCTPRDNDGPYTHVEVGYPDVLPPQSWAEYADGEYPDSVDVYGNVPVELVREYVKAHGGERDPHALARAIAEIEAVELSQQGKELVERLDRQATK